MMLGMILTPYGKVPGAYPSGITYSYGGQGNYLTPQDPQFNTHGEQGLYYDTMLGAPKFGLLTRWRLKKRLGLKGIPTDAELATAYGYTPVASAWVNAREGYFTNPWLPPNGWNPAGEFGPPVAPNELGAPSIEYTVVNAAGAVQSTQPAKHMVAGRYQQHQPHALRDSILNPNVATANDVAAVIDAMNAHNSKIFAITLVSTTAVALSAMIAIFRNLKLIRAERRLLDKEAKFIAART